ncbi:hypothetical protein L484_008352 [Morus notabilis]|uniref:MATH domain-containing protein n=1 Tax=Morus notabilis TaxID=981085 RepID=W9S817_9ROSA|nr:hypothetical protein L484_008352 [Morus notabilis]
MSTVQILRKPAVPCISASCFINDQDKKATQQAPNTSYTWVKGKSNTSLFFWHLIIEELLQTNNSFCRKAHREEGMSFPSQGTRAPHIGSNNGYTSKPENFSQAYKESYTSAKFTVQEKTWELRIFPNGYGDEEARTCVCICTRDSGFESRKRPLLRGVRPCTYEIELFSAPVIVRHNNWFANRKIACTADVISLKDIRKPSNGFLVKDLLILNLNF